MSIERTSLANETDFAGLEEYILTFARLASLGLQSSAIMHEVRNALTVLSGNVQILQMKGDRTTIEEVQQRLERMMAQIDRMEKSIGRVESFSRRTEGSARQVNPDTLIQNALFASSFVLRGTEQVKISEYASQTRKVCGDPNLLELLVFEMFQHLFRQIREGSLKIESSDADPNWELLLELTSSQDVNFPIQHVSSPGIRLAELIAMRLGGTLELTQETDRASCRLRLPWCAAAPDEADK